MKYETYGKQNIIKKNYWDIRNRLIINPMAIRIAKERGLALFNPKLNKIRLSISITLIIGCLVTFGTNIFIPFIIKWGLK